MKSGNQVIAGKVEDYSEREVGNQENDKVPYKVEQNHYQSSSTLIGVLHNS